MHFRLIEVESPETFEALGPLFREKTVDADGLRLLPIDITSPLYDALISKRSRNFLVYLSRPPESKLITALPATYEEFMAPRSAHTRQTLRREFRVIEKNYGPLAWRSYETEEEVDAFLDTAVPISDATWQAVEGFGNLTASESARQRYKKWASEGNLFAYTLREAQGKGMAFFIGRIRGETLYARTLGYDPTYADAGPTKLLIYRSIEMELNRTPRRFTSINWSVGEQPYKVKLATHKVVFSEFWLLKRSLRNAAWVASRTISRATVELLKHNQLILGLKRKILPTREQRTGGISIL